MPARARVPIVSPVEKRIDDDGLRHMGCAVRFIDGAVGVIEAIRKHRLVPLHLPFYSAGIRIEKQFGRMAALTVLRSPWAVNAEPITLPRSDIGQVAVPTEAGYFREVEACFVSLVIE